MAMAMVLDPKSSSKYPPPTRPMPPSSSSDPDDDLYSHLKSLQRQLEFIEIQEEYIKDIQKNLHRELLQAQEEVKRIQSVPLVIGQFIEMIDQNNAIIGSIAGSNYYVRILSTINRELLKPSTSMALHHHSNALVDVLPPEADSNISLLSQSDKPNVTYNVLPPLPFVNVILEPHHRILPVGMVLSILKHEWPARWQRFILDLVRLCRNILSIGNKTLDGLCCD